MTGFLIAGTSSGVGKTTVTLAIAAALRRRGLAVQLCKGGPDFLDAGHHGRISGRPARNLDTWLLSAESNVAILREAARCADAVLVEGMMGLFDGKSGADDEGSSAEIAKLLGLPVVLVVDASKSARSVAAVVLGFETFDPELVLAGVILNRVAGERHFAMLQAAIAARCKTPVLGWLPREAKLTIPERHLGLQTAQESSDAETQEQMDALAQVAERHLALDAMMSLQCGLDLSVPSRELEPMAKVPARVRVGVARDRAFMFYYEDNLELLRQCGAEIVSFSPLEDRTLPPMLDALYLGGGYPELYAERLSGNHGMLRAMREFAASQRPIYAECGGMMYLMASLTTSDGVTHAMAGVLPGGVEMTSGLRRFGYVTVIFTKDCLLGPKGTMVRGHSFHYSRMVEAAGMSNCYSVAYSLSGMEEQEGYGSADAQVLASYVHLHFRAKPAMAEEFVKAAAASRVACLTG